METIWKDVRYGIRRLIANPGFTAIAVIALALGIGANSAIFSVVNSIAIKPLPFSDPESLALVFETRPLRGSLRNSTSVPDFIDWRSRNDVFTEMGGYQIFSFNRTDGSEPERILGMLVTANFFDVLGLKPAIGRTFSLEEENSSNNNVALISYGYWQRNFGSNASAVGQSMAIDGKSITIIGVMPKDMRLPVGSDQADLWSPFMMDKETERGSHFLRTIARLKPGVTIEQAQANMESISQQLAKEHPNTNASEGVFVASMHEEVVGPFRTALYVLLASVGLVLLIACANVANLMLAKATARQKEIALRVALGATRGRLIRQLLTESLLLSLAGGLAGLLLAMWGVDLLISIAPDDIPRLSEIALDGRALIFTTIVTLLTSLVFGLAPALHASNPNLNESLKESGRSSATSFRRNPMRALFVITEVAFAVVLLIGAGLLIRSFIRLQHVDPGFDPHNLIKMTVTLPGTKYEEGYQLSGFFRQLKEKAESIPGSESVAIGAPAPMGGNNWTLSVVVKGNPVIEGQRNSAPWRSVSRDYFKTLRIPLKQGRTFNETDNEKSQKVIIINETMAREYFPNEDPIGRYLQIGYDDITCQIIGIVGDVRFIGIGADNQSEMYTFFEQTPSLQMNLFVRTEKDAASVAASVRSLTQSIDPDLPIYGIKMMQELVNESIANSRFNTLLLGIFAAVALLLATVGIYGVMSYSVTQRTQEIGIRMALGASSTSIMKLVIGQGMALALTGVAAGIVGALFMTGLMSSLLFGISDKDIITFISIPLLLALVALAACYIPARRAMKVNPIVALKYE